MSTAPIWYTADEMEHWLRCQKYAPNIAKELAEGYAYNLQRAFEKGFEIASRPQNELKQAVRLLEATVKAYQDGDQSKEIGRLAAKLRVKK